MKIGFAGSINHMYFALASKPKVIDAKTGIANNIWIIKKEKPTNARQKV